MILILTLCAQGEQLLEDMIEELWICDADLDISNATDVAFLCGNF